LILGEAGYQYSPYLMLINICHVCVLTASLPRYYAVMTDHSVPYTFFSPPSY